MKFKPHARTACLWIFLLAGLCASAQATIFVPRKAGYDGPDRRFIPVKQGGQWGYADTSRHIRIAPQFDAANPFYNNVAVVEMDRKAYAIDTTGRILTPGFDQLVLVEDSIISFYVNTVQDTLAGWGLGTLSGRVLLPAAYDQVEKLGPSLYMFRKDTLWGAIDRSGKLVVPLAYDTIYRLTPNLLVVRKQKRCGVFSIQGQKILEEKYDRLYPLNERMIAAYIGKKNPESINGTGWGAMHISGVNVVPFKYDTLIPLNRYFLPVKEGDSLACYFTATAGPPTPCIYKCFLPINGIWLRIYNFSDQCGLADTSGKMIFPVQYRDIAPSGRNTWFIVDTAGKWGMARANGEVLITPRYSHIQPFRGPVAITYDSIRHGLINYLGEIVIAPGYQEIIIRGSTVKVIHTDGSAEFLKIDANGRVIDRSNYDEFRVLHVKGKEAPLPRLPGDNSPMNVSMGGNLSVPAGSDSLSWFLSGRKQLWGLVNRFTGDTIFPAQFKSVSAWTGHLVVVGLSDTLLSMQVDEYQTFGFMRYGIINDSSGKYVVHPRYQNIWQQDLRANGFSGCVRASLPGGSMALVSTDGSERVTAYTWIEPLVNGYARVCLGGQWTMEGQGEQIYTVETLIKDFDLNGRKSFGQAVTVSSFLSRNICLARAKWGYVDATGKVIIAPQYEGAKSVFRNTGIVKQNKKWGMIDMAGAMRIPCAYDGLSYMKSDTGTLVLAQNNNVRFGYINREGSIVIPADLKQSKGLGNGMIGYTRNGKWGVMNAKGVQICAESYHEILPFSEGLAAVRRGNKWGYIDSTGAEVIALSYQKAGEFHEGLARVVIDQRWGYINSSGIVVVNAQFLQAGDFNGGAAPAKTREGYGLISREGKWLLKPTWQKISILDSAGPPIYIVRDDFLAGLCRSDGKMLIYPRYNNFVWLRENRIGFLSGLFWGLMDTTGRTLTDSRFDRIKNFSEHFAPAAENGLWGFIGLDGKFKIAAQYKTAGPFLDGHAYAYTEQHHACFIDTTGKFVLTLPSNELVGGYTENKYLILVYNKEGELDHMYYMTRHGLRVNRFDYKKAMPFDQGTARVSASGSSWGLISYTGFYLVKPRYMTLGPFENGIARFQMQTTQGLFSLEGNPILPVEYDWISYNAEMNLLTFERSNALGYLHTDGSMCWPETE